MMEREGKRGREGSRGRSGLKAVDPSDWSVCVCMCAQV